MAKTRILFACVGLAMAVLSAGAFALLKVAPSKPGAARVIGVKRTAAPKDPAETSQPARVPPVALTFDARRMLNSLNAKDQESVTSFLANTSGPLDNYLFDLEGMVNMANARYGAPEKDSWRRALPIARVLEQGMCDCAQRNWLNQFVALGRVGLAGDLTQYHAQGAVMAAISRCNGDTGNGQLVINAAAH